MSFKMYVLGIFLIDSDVEFHSCCCNHSQIEITAQMGTETSTSRTRNTIKALENGTDRNSARRENHRENKSLFKDLYKWLHRLNN